MADHPPVRVGLIGAGSIARAHAIAYANARTYCGPEVPPVALRRLPRPEEIVSALLFLASDEASYITGV